ncbi:hypothetical protein M5K25_019642 [Dendrobium thyrsiflorum]|uniref:Uncharacterized protein n=1 Tax=Dendrobium thyrsiflorum TaxID=117978 RepID=A0ABD0UG46_DENTH
MEEQMRLCIRLATEDSGFHLHTSMDNNIHNLIKRLASGLAKLVQAERHGERGEGLASFRLVRTGSDVRRREVFGYVWLSRTGSARTEGLRPSPGRKHKERETEGEGGRRRSRLASGVRTGAGSSGSRTGRLRELPSGLAFTLYASRPMEEQMRLCIRLATEDSGFHLHTSMDNNIHNLIKRSRDFPYSIHQLK